MSTNLAATANSFSDIVEDHHGDDENYSRDENFAHDDNLSKLIDTISNGSIDSWEKANGFLHSIFGFRSNRVFDLSLNESLGIFDPNQVKEVLEVSDNVRVTIIGFPLIIKFFSYFFHLVSRSKY